MAFPADILGTTSFKNWREAFNTVKNAVPERIEATADPTSSDFNYPIGSIWIRTDTTPDSSWILVDNTGPSSAIWQKNAASGGAFHDGFSDYVANEHINWTSGTATGFHSIGIDDNATSLRLILSDSELALSSQTIIQTNNTGSRVLAGGDSAASGGVLWLFGGAHSTKANDLEFSASGTLKMKYDHSVPEWNFQSVPIVTTGVVSGGGFEAAGAGTVGIYRDFANVILSLSGDLNSTSGANIQLYGSAYTGKLGYMEFRNGSTITAQYAPLLSEWDFQANAIKTTGIVTADSVIMSEQGAPTGAGTGTGKYFVRNLTPSAPGFVNDVGTIQTIAVDGGAFHDGFSDYVANEHIDWTAATQNLSTSGNITASGTGELFGYRLTLSNFVGVHMANSSGYITLSGGAGSSNGASLMLFGDSVPPFSNDIEFTTGVAVTQLYFDDSADLWDFQANDITTTGVTTSGGFKISNDNGISRTTTSDYLVLSGSNQGVAGAALYLYGNTHATVPNEMFFQVTAITQLHYDGSSEWDFQANNISTTGSISAGGTDTRIGTDGIYFEGDNHAITFNDGFGNFNLRVASNGLADANCTEAGYMLHGLFTQSTGTWEWKVSNASMTVGGTPTWLTQIEFTPTAVSLSYGGSTKLATVTGGVDITGICSATSFSGSISGLSGTKTQFNSACSDGTFLFVGDISAGGLSVTYKTANYTAVAGDFVVINNGATNRTITLPATIAAGDRIAVHGYSSTAGITTTVARNGKQFLYQGSAIADDLVLASGETVELAANGTTYWVIV